VHSAQCTAHSAVQLSSVQCVGHMAPWPAAAAAAAPGTSPWQPATEPLHSDTNTGLWTVWQPWPGPQEGLRLASTLTLGWGSLLRHWRSGRCGAATATPTPTSLGWWEQLIKGLLASLPCSFGLVGAAITSTGNAGTDAGGSGTDGTSGTGGTGGTCGTGGTGGAGGTGRSCFCLVLPYLWERCFPWDLRDRPTHTASSRFRHCSSSSRLR
jgi:hypothetical protein